MFRILFVCHGNICRSPMAEFVMKRMVKEKGVAERFEIASAATSSDDLGQPVHPGSRKIMAENGIRCEGKTSRRLTLADFAQYDRLVGMDDENIWRMRQLARKFKEPHAARKISRLLDFTDAPGEISDPWFHNDFKKTWNEVNEGCKALLEHCLKTSAD